jgi:hypothetical protein
MHDRPGSSAERRAALLMLQRLLANADASLSAQSPNIARILEHVSKAFDYFRTQYHDAVRSSAASASASEAQVAAIVTLASAIAEMDESVSKRDSEKMRAALDVARQAVDTCRRLDEPAQTSGIRMRFPSDPDALAPGKRGRQR